MISNWSVKIARVAADTRTLKHEPSTVAATAAGSTLHYTPEDAGHFTQPGPRTRQGDGWVGLGWAGGWGRVGLGVGSWGLDRVRQARQVGSSTKLATFICRDTGSPKGVSLCVSLPGRVQWPETIHTPRHTEEKGIRRWSRRKGISRGSLREKRDHSENAS